MKIIYLNGNIRRENSRTNELANYFLSLIKDFGQIKEINIMDDDPRPKNTDFFAGNYQIQDKYYQYAKEVKDADLIILSCPFYDMGLPSLVHAFLENISLDGETFISKNNTFMPNIKAKKLIYITTRGDNIADNSLKDGATYYLRALGQLWGYQEVINLSYSGTDVNDLKTIMKRKNQAYQKAQEIVNNFLKE